MSAWLRVLRELPNDEPAGWTREDWRSYNAALTHVDELVAAVSEAVGSLRGIEQRFEAAGMHRTAGQVRDLREKLAAVASQEART